MLEFITLLTLYYLIGHFLIAPKRFPTRNKVMIGFLWLPLAICFIVECLYEEYKKRRR